MSGYHRHVREIIPLSECYLDEFGDVRPQRFRYCDICKCVPETLQGSGVVRKAGKAEDVHMMKLSEVEKHLAAQAANEAFKDAMVQIAKDAALQSIPDSVLSESRDLIIAGRRRFCALLELAP